MSLTTENRAITKKRFVFYIPSLNVIRPFLALSVIEAQQMLMDSSLAPYYGQAVLLTPHDRR
jgi:hypothetical protein